MWYPCFIAATVLLACFGRPEARTTWAVIAGAALVSAGLGLWLDTVDVPWKLIVYCALEVATAGALVRLGSGLIARLMLAATVLAWLAHATLYVDIITGYALIYDHYESVILAICLAQLAAGLGGFRHALTSLFRVVGERVARAGRTRLAGSGFARSADSGVEEVSEVQGHSSQ